MTPMATSSCFQRVFKAAADKPAAPTKDEPAKEADNGAGEKAAEPAAEVLAESPTAAPKRGWWQRNT